MAVAQNTITDEIITDQIERMLENSDDEVDFTELIEEYWNICENKININNPDELNQLIDLHLVNVFLVENINDYRKNFGDFMMFDELTYVEGMDEMTLNILKPLICFEKSNEKKRLHAKDLWKYGQHQTIYQMERCFNDKIGYKEHKYIGNPQKMLLRYSFTSMKRLEFFQNNCTRRLSTCFRSRSYDGFGNGFCSKRRLAHEEKQEDSCFKIGQRGKVSSWHRNHIELQELGLNYFLLEQKSRREPQWHRIASDRERTYWTSSDYATIVWRQHKL